MTGNVGNNSRQQIFSTTTVTVFRKNLVEAMGGGGAARSVCGQFVRVVRVIMSHLLVVKKRSTKIDDGEEDGEDTFLSCVVAR